MPASSPRAADFERCNDAVVDQANARPVRSAAHGRADRADIAVAVVRGDIAVLGGERRWPDLSRIAGGRLFDGHDRGQGLVIDLDQISAVLGCIARLGNDHGDRVAHEAHDIGSQWQSRRRDDRRTIGPLVKMHEGHTGQAVGDHVGAGENGDHAGRTARVAGIDRADSRVGMRRAHEPCVRLTRYRKIVSEATLTAEQTIVFQPAQRLADPWRAADLRGSVHARSRRAKSEA